MPIKKKKEEEESHSKWKDRLSRMGRYMKENSTTWDRNKKLLFGEFENSEKKQEVSYAWGLVKGLETSIYVQNPEMICESYDITRRDAARLITRICNYDIDQMDLKSIGNEGLIDIFTCGFFACIETVQTDKKYVRFKPEDGEGEQGVDVTDQNFDAARIDPKDFRVDSKALKLDLSDANYLAVAFYPTIEDLENDPTFTDLPDDWDGFPEASPLAPTDGPEEAKQGGAAKVPPGHKEEKDPAFKRIKVWECQDKVNKEFVYVTDHRKLEIGRIDWPVKLRIGKRNLFPVTIMAMHKLPGKWYPKPELDLIANQLMILNQIDARIYKDGLTKWRKYVTFAGLFSPEQAAKITDPTVENAIMEIDRDAIEEMAGENPSLQAYDVDHLVAAIKDPEPNKDLFAVREMVKNEINEILGYGPPDRAGIPKTRSAREAIAIKEKLEQRLAKRADAVADFYRDFGQKHILMLQQKMLLERYVRVVPDIKQLSDFKQYSQDDIQGEFHFIVYAGTSMPRNTESKKNQELEIFRVFMPLAQAGLIPIEPIILRLAEALQWKGVDLLLKNYKPTVKKLALVLAAMKTQKVPPNALPEIAAATVQAVLTPEEIQNITKEAMGQAGTGATQPEEPQETRGEATTTKRDMAVT